MVRVFGELKAYTVMLEQRWHGNGGIWGKDPLTDRKDSIKGRGPKFCGRSQICDNKTETVCGRGKEKH